MSRAVFILMVLVAVVALCAHETSAQRGRPGRPPVRPPGRHGPGRPGRPGRPRPCGPNEIWKNCGTACAPTCRNQNPRGPCPAICRIGCQCKRGFVLQDRWRGRCVRPSQCSHNKG